MKIKFVSILVTVIFAVLNCNLCFAAETTVTREYIKKNIGGERTHEEKLLVNCNDLQLTQGDFVRFSFYNGAMSKIKEYEIEMPVIDFIQNEMTFKSESLYGTEYVEVEIIGVNFDYTSGMLPLQIKK